MSKFPGTAFTRSLGDKLAKQLGVTSDPETGIHPIPDSGATFVIGSDGVFDFICDHEVASIVMESKDPEKACRELVGKAWHRWSESEERVDDITVIVGHIAHARSCVEKMPCFNIAHWLERKLGRARKSNAINDSSFGMG
jgi:serine/threonine protein phosphatase PrpC